MSSVRQLVAPFLLCAVSVAACRLDPWVNHFVVPAGYHGPIAVVSHPSFESFSTSQATEEGYVHFVPPMAVVCVASDRMFNGYRLTAEYSDGSPIVPIVPTQIPTIDSIAISGFGAWGGGAKGVSAHWFGVGTQEEVAALERAFFSNQLESMMPSGVSMNPFGDFQQFGRYCEGSP